MSRLTGYDLHRPPMALTVAAILFVIVGFVAKAQAITHLNRGAEAADIEAADLAGAKVKLSDLRGRVVVLVFGEVYHENTREAWQRLRNVLEGERFQGRSIEALLVVAQDVEPQAIKAQADEHHIVGRILHDRQRRAYEAYRVAVLPSAVVIDANGRIVHALAPLSVRADDVMADALLLAIGAIEPDVFDRRRNPDEQSNLTADQLRARRITRLADQLERRGMVDVAIEKYEEAVLVDPTYAQSHLGLGLLALRQRRLAIAERHFQAVLAIDGQSVDANLGLAYLQAMRGGDELVTAKAMVQRVLGVNPNQPRAHYMMGLIHEKQGQLQESLGSYRHAAELLLQRMEQERSHEQ